MQIIYNSTSSQSKMTYPTLLSSSSSSSNVSMLLPHLFVLDVANGVVGAVDDIVVVVPPKFCVASDNPWRQLTSHSASRMFISCGNGLGKNLLRPNPVRCRFVYIVRYVWIDYVYIGYM